jgi:predicted short-subunit dehydrogenase-like oxidoreductase (DUF2520 family)
MARYFELENIRYINWNRNDDSASVSEKLFDCNVILILISDKSIASFIEENPSLKTKRLIHFSGSLNIGSIYGIHPLMTFGLNMYELSTYREIPFIVDNGVSFLEIFPKFKNKYYSIKPELKPLYHSLCVISGNFPTMLWQKTMRDFENKLGLSKNILIPYIKQILKNIENNYDNALTGPIQRGDELTMKNNIKALDEDEWKNLYRAFQMVYKKEKLNGN